MELRVKTRFPLDSGGFSVGDSRSGFLAHVAREFPPIPIRANRMTHDPVSGQPFGFDPAQRTLAIPPGSLEQEEKPLVLPW